MEDRQIVELYWQRSEQAVAETDRKYGRYCEAIAYAVCSDRQDAEECVNDTWLRAWNAMPDERPTALGAFLGRITRNLAINLFERKNRQKRGGGQMTVALEELEDCIPGREDPQRQVELEELRQALGRFVAELNETEKMVFTARYWYLKSVEEIAGRMGFTQSRVKSLLFRLRRRLGRYLEEEGLC